MSRPLRNLLRYSIVNRSWEMGVSFVDRRVLIKREVSSNLVSAEYRRVTRKVFTKMEDRALVLRRTRDRQIRVCVRTHSAQRRDTRCGPAWVPAATWSTQLAGPSSEDDAAGGSGGSEGCGRRVPGARAAGSAVCVLHGASPRPLHRDLSPATGGAASQLRDISRRSPAVTMETLAGPLRPALRGITGPLTRRCPRASRTRDVGSALGRMQRHRTARDGGPS